ncbi:hypothetical protein VPNG_04509 [Cytospora leucostoma]|uniref:GH16 domain-containing protein n=1 Tax=Cytospora leucostoma TaxID=1230097 RepID=A0A423XCF1_9PEZI|nr:hypothetical protein VPNG_04509 [Cytospora leucostoma]
MPPQAMSRPERVPHLAKAKSPSGGRSEEPPGPRYFHSRRVRKDQVVKPWTKEPKDPKEKWVTIIPLIGLSVGLCVAAFIIWDGLRSVVNHKYCMVLEEDWSQGFRSDIWQAEIKVGGFGNGEFEMTTDASENLFVNGSHLFIRATLQDEELVTKNNMLDLGPKGSGTCTGSSRRECVAATNTTAGNSSIVPPVLSARINTKASARIKYGRVEVVAKLPKGDWLWPAIWMMPANDTYGPWPASGEIDVVESRGNNHTYAQGGDNVVSSALHWGPDLDNDMWWRTYHRRTARHTTYSDGFNTFAVEWSQKYLFTYVNNRLMQVLYTPFREKENMWRRGSFPHANANGTELKDPWGRTGRPNTPFDHEFYLIINLAVGGTNGWFKDGKSGKPWLDTSPKANKDFWEARGQWYPTWTQPYIEVKSVRIDQQCDGDEFEAGSRGMDRDQREAEVDDGVVGEAMEKANDKAEGEDKGKMV